MLSLAADDTHDSTVSTVCRSEVCDDGGVGSKCIRGANQAQDLRLSLQGWQVPGRVQPRSLYMKVVLNLLLGKKGLPRGFAAHCGVTIIVGPFFGSLSGWLTSILQMDMASVQPLRKRSNSHRLFQH